MSAKSNEVVVETGIHNIQALCFTIRPTTTFDQRVDG